MIKIIDYSNKYNSEFNKLGLLLHKKFKFNIDEFNKCKLLLDDTKLIGFITYTVIYERAEILDIVIDDNFRNKGYGNILLNSCIDDIKKSNCINITLEVSENNLPAIELYKKNGFKILSVRKNYYHNNDEYVDAYLMKKDLR